MRSLPRSRRGSRPPGRTGSRRRSRCARYSSRKYLIERGDRADRAVAERAERAAQDVVALVEQQRRGRPRCPGPARAGASVCTSHQVPSRHGRALAARLVLVELGPAQHGAHHAGGLVEDLQRAGAEHRAGRADALEVERARRGARRSASGCRSRPGSRTSARGPRGRRRRGRAARAA